MKLSLYYPTKPWRVNQPFGNLAPMYTKLGMKGHNGIDAYAVDAQPVRVTHDGIVTFTGEDGGGGLGVVVRTNEQFDYQGKQSYFKSIYWHLKPNTFKVKPNQQVKMGDILALADNTGMSTGTHLHFGLKPIMQGEYDWAWANREQNNGYFGAIDPQPYFCGVAAEDMVQYKGLLVSLVAVLERLVEALKKKTL